MAHYIRPKPIGQQLFAVVVVVVVLVVVVVVVRDCQAEVTKLFCQSDGVVKVGGKLFNLLRRLEIFIGMRLKIVGELFRAYTANPAIRKIIMEPFNDVFHLFLVAVGTLLNRTLRAVASHIFAWAVDGGLLYSDVTVVLGSLSRRKESRIG